jgi:hypothetical protein
MAMTEQTLGLGRVGLKKIYAVEAEKVDKQYLIVVGGRVDKTTQASEVYKQYAGFGPAVQISEGQEVSWDDLTALYNLNAKPVIYSKGVQFSVQTSFTDQYGVLKKIQPDFAKAFTHARNAAVADLDNSGFTNTTYGMNSETLYAAGHNMKGVYGYNRPLAPGQVAGASATTLDLAFGPLALEQAFIDLRKQISARNTPMPTQGKITPKVPSALYPQATRAVTAFKGLAGTNNNDPNFNRQKFDDPAEVLYYTSQTAWFCLASNVNNHGIFFLEQKPYEIVKLPPQPDLMEKWIAYETWTFGWYDWHGSWGTLGQ